MASGTTIANMNIALQFDGKSLSSSMNTVEKQAVKQASNAGEKSGNALSAKWAVAAGAIAGVTQQVFSKVVDVISSSVSSAVKRVDTMANYPKVMQSLGFASDEASASIKTMSDHLDGLPTALNDMVENTQNLAATLGNLNKGTVNATSVGLAFNDMMLAGGQGTQAATNAFTQYNQMLAAGKVDQQAWNSLVTAAPGQMKQLAQTLLGATANQKDLYKALQEGIISFDDMNAAIVKLDKEGGEGFASYSEQARNATGGIGTALENVQNRISKAISAIIDAIGSENIAAAINTISGAIIGLGNVIAGVINFIKENEVVRDALIAALITIGIVVMTSVVPAFIAWAAALLANPITWIILGVTALITGLILLVTHIQEVGQFFLSIFGAVGEFVSGIWNGIIQGAQNVWNFITGLFSGLANFFGSIFSAAWEAVKAVFSTGGRIFSGIVDGIATAFKNIVNVIIRGINAVVAIPFNAINGFLSFLKGIDILGIKPFEWVGTITVPQIPLLKQGGYANAPTAAIFGEAGAEVALPLENNTGNWAGLLANTLANEMADQELTTSEARPVVVNFYDTTVRDDNDIQKITQGISQVMRRSA